MQVGMAARSNGPLLRTVDGGQTWIELPAPPIGLVNGLTGGNSVLAMVDRSSAVMIAQDGVYRTADSGNSWIRTLAVGYPSNLGLNAVSARGNLVLAAAFDGHLHRSFDGGRSWSASVYGGSRPTSITWSSNSTVFILDVFGALTGR
jgi:photosystem II stability/assembly factor-like uncharacterized protein